jgi:cell volume regulation protein A
MVIREGESIPAEARTVLRHGDDLLVVAPRSLRERTERRLRQVSRHGRLAGWVAPRR